MIDDQDARRDEQAVDGLVIAEPQHEKKGQQQDDQPQHFHEEFRHFDVMLLFEIEFPNVAVHEGDEKNRAEDERDPFCVIKKRPMQLKENPGKINGDAQSKGMVQPAELDAVLAFQPAAQQQHETEQTGDRQKKEQHLHFRRQAVAAAPVVSTMLVPSFKVVTESKRILP